MKDRVTQDLNNYLAEQEKAEVTYLFHSYEDEVNQAIARAYRDPNKVWDAIGLNGVIYPELIDSIPVRAEKLIAQADYDNDLALQLGAYLEDEDYAAFGQLLGEMAKERIRQDALDLYS
jgi:hypothetical protein